MLQIFLTATPFYQRTWFWILLFIASIFLFFYGLRWFARRKYRAIMEARRAANARIKVLLREMEEQ